MAKNTGWLLIANTTSRLFTAVFIILLANHLMPASFGIYNFAFALSYIASVIPEWGFDALLVREVSKERGKGPTMLSNVFFMRSLLALFSLSVLVLLYFTFIQYWDVDLTLKVLLTVAAMLFLERLSDSFFAYFRANDRMDIQSMVTVVWKIFYLSLGFLAISLGFALFSILVFLLISAIIRLFFSIIVYLNMERTGFEKPNILRWKILLKNASPFAIITFLGMVYGHLIVVFLIFLGGEYTTGVYSASWKIIVFLGLVPHSFGSALYPLFSRQYASEKRALKHTYKHSIRYLFIISLPISIGLFFTGDRFFDLIFIAEYSPAFGLLRILVWMLPFLFMNGSLKMVLWAGEKARSASKNLAIATSVLAIGGLILIPLFGAEGAAAIVVIAEAIHFSANYNHIRSYFGSVEKEVLYKPISAGLVMSALLAAQRFYLADGKIITFTVSAFSALVYFLILYSFGMISRKDIELVKKLFGEVS